MPEADARRLFREGKLSEAVTAQGEQVRAQPTDCDGRWFLAELLCFTGDLQRADAQLEAVERFQPESRTGVSLFRQLVRAAQWRVDFFDQGRPPELVSEPSPALRARLEGSLQLRLGDERGAAELLERATELEGSPAGECDGRRFAELRDLDDRTAGILEVLTPTGKYTWVPLEHAERLELRPPARPRDLLWRRAALTVRGGPEGEVFLPAIYHDPRPESPEDARMGHRTDWIGEEDGVVCGVGLRTYWIEGETRTILELGRIELDPPAESPAGGD